MHILIVSGQNLVIQNATALATACHAATQGLRVLMVGTGPLGLLGSLLGEELQYRPMEIGENLHAMELFALGEFSQRWEILCKDPKYGITGRLRDVGNDEITSFPSMDEMAALIVADRAGSSGKFDLVVFGGTTIDSLLRGITMRETIRWLTRIVSGLSRGPGSSRSSQEDAILPASILNALSSASTMQDLRIALERYTLWLDARTGTRIRLVLPVEEMSHLFMTHVMNGLGLYNMQADAVFALGDEERIDASVRERLQSLLVTHTVPTTPTDIKEWAERGELLYKQRTSGLGLPSSDEITMSTPPQFVEQKEVRLHIPFLDPKALDIGIASEEVIVTLGQFRRHFLVSGMEKKGANLRAKVEGKVLRLWIETESSSG